MMLDRAAKPCCGASKPIPEPVICLSTAALPAAMPTVDHAPHCMLVPAGPHPHISEYDQVFGIYDELHNSYCTVGSW